MRGERPAKKYNSLSQSGPETSPFDPEYSATIIRPPRFIITHRFCAFLCILLILKVHNTCPKARSCHRLTRLHTVIRLKSNKFCENSFLILPLTCCGFLTMKNPFIGKYRSSVHRRLGCKIKVLVSDNLPPAFCKCK